MEIDMDSRKRMTYHFIKSLYISGIRKYENLFTKIYYELFDFFKR